MAQHLVVCRDQALVLFWFRLQWLCTEAEVQLRLKFHCELVADGTLAESIAHEASCHSLWIHRSSGQTPSSGIPSQESSMTSASCRTIAS